MVLTDVLKAAVDDSSEFARSRSNCSIQWERAEHIAKNFRITPLGIVSNKIKNVPVLGDAVSAITSTASDVVDVAFDAASTAGSVLIDGINSLGSIFSVPQKKKKYNTINKHSTLSFKPFTNESVFEDEPLDILQWKFDNLEFEYTEPWLRLSDRHKHTQL